MPKRTAIYHITHIDNLSSIIACGGLGSTTWKTQQGTQHKNIAHDTVQDQRANTNVPCGQRGCLHDYVPFYFAARSPMLCSIHHGRVEGYNGGQQEVIHLVACAEDISAGGCSCVFTDGHGIMALTDFYDDLAHLNKVDWKIMKAKYWSDTQEDGDRKRRRQAEFLVHNFLPLEMVTTIGVMTATVQTRVQRLIQGASHKPVIKVDPEWYY
jgi:hypothetical protein